MNANSYESSPGRMLQAFNFALEPTAEQEAAVRRHFGARRYACNWTVAEIKRELDLYRECGVSFGPPSLFRLRKRWNRDKHRLALDADGNPWWTEVSKEAFSNGIADAVDAYWRWQKSGKKDAQRVGFPRFRRKGRDADRYRVTTGAFELSGRRHVKLPRVGLVRAHPNTRRLERLIGLGRARLLNVTVRRRGRRLLAVFQVKLIRPQCNVTPTDPGSVVGVDAGVRRLATVARPDGETIERITSPRALNRNLGPVEATTPGKSEMPPGISAVQAKAECHIHSERADSQSAFGRDSQTDDQACQAPRHGRRRVSERVRDAQAETHPRGQGPEARAVRRLDVGGQAPAIVQVWLVRYGSH